MTDEAYQTSVKAAKSQYYADLINQNAHRPQILFNTINSILNPTSSISNTPIPSSALCESFLNFFTDKINNIRTSISLTLLSPANINPAPPAVNHLHHFQPVSFNLLSDVVSHLKSTFSPSDIIPSRLFKEVFSTIGPLTLEIINSCLKTGVVPCSFKHATVHPLLKKPSLDPSVLNNFRPISKLPFISKILEKVVFTQVSAFLNTFNSMDKFQSGFRNLHSTETALLKVHNDILLTVDSGSCAILIMLDLTAAFDTIDHNVLLKRIEHEVGFKSTVLNWFTSYLNNRTFNVTLGTYTSSSAPITCGVPQGSILGPLLFSLYMLPLGSIFKKHGIPYQFYADDTQFYLPVTPNDTSFNNILNCLEDIKIWMATNFLQLNQNKTEVILFGPQKSIHNLKSSLGPLSMNLRNTVKNLGVHLDSSLNFNKQVSSVVSSSFYQLRTIAKLKPILSHRDLETVIHAFITSRLDYCNSLYHGLTQSTLSRLQMVQNSAARLLTGTKMREHITPVLAQLHWLPVKHRINFKILLFVFKARNGLAPEYIADLLSAPPASRVLRSTTQMSLAVPQTSLKTKGDRAFSVIAPKLWNSLPLHVKSSPTVESFKSSLKTHLFSIAFS